LINSTDNDKNNLIEITLNIDDLKINIEEKIAEILALSKEIKIYNDKKN
jgi:hypothetical protein